MKKLTLLLCFLLTIISFGQDTIASDSTYFNPDFGVKPMAVTDHNNNIFLFFLRNGDGPTVVLKYDKDYNLLVKKTITRKNYGYSKIRGYGLDEANTIYLYFTNSTSKNLLIQSLDENGDSSETKITLDIEGEKIIDGFTINNIFHLLAYTKGTSEINRYSFNGANYEKTIYNLFKNELCNNAENSVCNLKHLFNKREIQFISDEVPATISQTENKLKIYPTTDKIQITSDYSVGTTQLITLSLSDNTFELSSYPYPNGYNNFKIKTRMKSNSFLYKDFIFQILASKKQCILFIKNLSNNTVLKTYSFTEEENINFKNSEIYQDNGSFSVNTKVLTDSKKFLNLLSKGSIAITVEEKGNNILMVFGGVTAERSSSMPMMGMPIMNFPIGNFGSFNLFMNAFFTVENSMTTYTRSLLNKDTFEQEKGFAGINIFELIHVYKTQDVKLKKVIRENIFKNNGDYIYGYYNPESSKYTLLRF